MWPILVLFSGLLVWGGTLVSGARRHQRPRIPTPHPPGAAAANSFEVRLVSAVRKPGAPGIPRVKMDHECITRNKMDHGGIASTLTPKAMTVVDGFVYPCVKSYKPLPGYSRYAGYTTFIPAPNGDYIAGTVACIREGQLSVDHRALVDSLQVDHLSAA